MQDQASKVRKLFSPMADNAKPKTRTVQIGEGKYGVRSVY